MSYRRAQVRDAVAAALAATSTPAERIFVSRVYPDVAVDDGPTLSVYLESEESDAEGHSTGADGEYQDDRRATVVVEGRALWGDGLDDILDAQALEVEQALAADRGLGGVVNWIEFSGSEIERDDSRERPVAVQTLSFEAWYVVNADDPQ